MLQYWYHDIWYKFIAINIKVIWYIKSNHSFDTTFLRKIQMFFTLLFSLRGVVFYLDFFFGGGLFGMFYVLCCQYYIKNTPEWSDIHDLRDNYSLIMINHLTCLLFKLAVSIFNMFGLIDGLVLTCKSLFVHGFCWTCRKSV